MKKSNKPADLYYIITSKHETAHALACQRASNLAAVRQRRGEVRQGREAETGGRAGGAETLLLAR